MKKQKCTLDRTVAFISLGINFVLIFFISYSDNSLQNLEDKVEKLQKEQYISTSSGTVTSTYPGCDTADIAVGSYTIAACNVGASQAGTGTESYGEMFQAGRNKGFLSSDLSQQDKILPEATGIDLAQDSYGFVWGVSLPAPYSWALGDITDNWGQTTNTSSARQGPCATGYHVPSQNEWVAVVESGGWDYDSKSMSEKLKLPFAGFRDWHYGKILQKRTNGYYWSSSFKPTEGYYLSLHEYGVNTDYKANFANGFSVRCFKN